ncbi:MAG: hypothetical protein P8Y13_01360 [Deinococcales bacterium]
MIGGGRGWRRLGVAAIIAVVGGLLGVPARAASIRVGQLSPAMPGDVVAIPLRTQGPGTVELHAAAGLTVLGTSAQEHGNLLATVLVDPSARAGPHRVLVTLDYAGSVTASATARIVVETVVKATLHGAPPPKAVVAGTSFQTTLTLVNEGNAAETFALSASGADPSTLTPAHLHLGPGASGTVRFQVTPRAFGHRVAIVTAAAIGSSYDQRLVYDYDALPFPGANPSAPLLDLSLPFSVSYGTTGFEARASADISGNLSDFIRTDSGVSYGGGVGGHAGLLGNDWSVEYRYRSSAGQDLTGSYRGLTGTVAYSRAGTLRTGVGYTVGAFGVSYDHAWTTAASDALSVSYGVPLTPWLQLTGHLGATGEDLPSGYRVGPLVGATLQGSGLGLLGDLGGVYTPRGESPWQATLDLYSQAIRPVGFGASATVTPTGSTGNLSVYQALGPSVVTSQHARYTASGSQRRGSGRFSVAYLLPGHLGSVRTALQGQLSQGRVQLSGSLFSVVAPLPWVTRIGVTESGGWNASVDETYVGNGFSVGAGASAPIATPVEPVIDAHGSVQVAPVTAGVTLDYQTSTGRLYGSARLSYQFTHALALQGTVGIDPNHALTYRIGLSANFLTGLQVPPSVVSAFGGLRLGTVRGRVVRHTASGTKGVPGVVVVAAAANRQARTDRHGDFALRLPPGTTPLQLANLPLDLTAVGSPRVTVRLHRTTTIAIVVKRSFSVSGQVYTAAPGSRHPTAQSRGLAFVTVRLIGSQGKQHTTATDASGDFVFNGLAPGHYLLALAQRSLPAGYHPSESSVSVDLGPANSAPSIELGATPPKTVVTTTLTAGSLALHAHVSPSTAPAGAQLTVTATAPGATRVSVHWATGSSVTLTPLGGGRFQGTVTLPGLPPRHGRPAPTGAETLQVTARTAKHSVTQDETVIVTSGRLAALTLTPGFATPGERIRVVARLLVKASQVAVRLHGASTALRRTGPGTFTGVVSAPTTAGTFTVTLLVDGKQLAEGHLAVRAPGS